MAAKPKNYNRRVIDSRGAHFRIVSGDPLVGSTGAEVCKVYAVNDNDDSFLISHSQGGLSRIAAEKTLEVRAGDKNNPHIIDIRVSAANGDVTITATNGSVRVNAKNIMMQASQDIDIHAGRNVNVTAGQRILYKANTVNVEGKRGNGIVETFGMKMFAGSFVPGDLVEAALGPFASPSILGIGKAAFGAATGGNLGGFVADTVISSTGIGGVAGGAVKTALGGFLS